MLCYFTQLIECDTSLVPSPYFHSDFCSGKIEPGDIWGSKPLTSASWNGVLPMRFQNCFRHIICLQSWLAWPPFARNHCKRRPTGSAWIRVGCEGLRANFLHAKASSVQSPSVGCATAIFILQVVTPHRVLSRNGFLVRQNHMWIVM